MEASSSQFPSSRTRKRTSAIAIASSGGGGGGGGGDGDGDNTRTVVVTRNLDEGRLRARERQRRKRERDRAGRDKSSGPTRKISEQDDGEEQRRLKARERQRRKRERDRSLRGLSVDGSRTDVGGLISPQNGETKHSPDIDDPNANPSNEQGKMTPDERAKKEKIRQSARERQRKHRALVKARRMAEMDVDVDVDMVEGDVEQPVPVMNEHEHHESVIEPHPYLLHPDLHVTSEASSFPFPVPQPYMTPGQTFAQILLLSISYTPTLRQELLQNLQMSEEDLISLMPMIASAWDQWNYNRSISLEDHNTASTSYIIPPSSKSDAIPGQDQVAADPDPDLDAEPEPEADAEVDADAGQSPELSHLPSTDFPETPLVSIIYHLKNRLGQLFTRENRNRH